MDQTKKDQEIREDGQKQWNEGSSLETREDGSAFNPTQSAPNFFQQQNPHALCPPLSTVGLQNSSALPQMPVYPSRFYYQCYAPPPYPRPMYDPCASYPALYQSEGNNDLLSTKLITCHNAIKNTSRFEIFLYELIFFS